MNARSWGGLRAASPLPVPKPFVKWVGGKSPILDQLSRFLPRRSEAQSYFEPFVGSGAVFFYLQPERASLSDLNAPLIEAYLAIRDHLDELTDRLNALPSPRLGSKLESEYYTKRAEYNALLRGLTRLGADRRLTLAALFIWLNHTCFNGLYRVNGKGEFNAAFGENPNSDVFSYTNLRAVRRALRQSRSVITCQDFEDALKPAREGDLVYLDPPYPGENAGLGYAKYTSARFDEATQARLARVVHDLLDRKCKVVMSNSHTPRNVELYRDLKLGEVQAPRLVNRDANGRGRVRELIVMG